MQLDFLAAPTKFKERVNPVFLFYLACPEGEIKTTVGDLVVAVFVSSDKMQMPHRIFVTLLEPSQVAKD